LISALRTRNWAKLKVLSASRRLRHGRVNKNKTIKRMAVGVGIRDREREREGDGAKCNT